MSVDYLDVSRNEVWSSGEIFQRFGRVPVGAETRRRCQVVSRTQLVSSPPALKAMRCFPSGERSREYSGRSLLLFSQAHALICDHFLFTTWRTENGSSDVVSSFVAGSTLSHRLQPCPCDSTPTGPASTEPRLGN